MFWCNFFPDTCMNDVTEPLQHGSYDLFLGVLHTSPVSYIVFKSVIIGMNCSISISLSTSPYILSCKAELRLVFRVVLKLNTSSCLSTKSFSTYSHHLFSICTLSNIVVAFSQNWIDNVSSFSSSFSFAFLTFFSISWWISLYFEGFLFLQILLSSIQ